MTKDGKLNSAECVQLFEISILPGWNVLFAIVERELENLRIELQNTDPVDEKQVISRQRVVYSAQKHWALVMHGIDEALSFSANIPVAPVELSPEQTEQLSTAALLDATRLQP